MKSLLASCVLLVAAWLDPGQTAVAQQSGKQLRPIRILVVGDSTVASYRKPPQDRPDLTGWGQVLGERFNNRVTVVNRALSGASSKSFVKRGYWNKALAERATGKGKGELKEAILKEVLGKKKEGKEEKPEKELIREIGGRLLDQILD